MFIYYLVSNTYEFSHYGEASTFCRQIGGYIEVKKSWNPLRVFNTIYDSI